MLDTPIRIDVLRTMWEKAQSDLKVAQESLKLAEERCARLEQMRQDFTLQINKLLERLTHQKQRVVELQKALTLVSVERRDDAGWCLWCSAARPEHHASCVQQHALRTLHVSV